MKNFAQDTSKMFDILTTKKFNSCRQFD